MRKSRLSQQKQVRLIEHFVAGTTARCAADLIGVNRNTTAYYFKRLREIIIYELEQVSQEVFEGEIEVDESYFGGARKGNRGCVFHAKWTPIPRQSGQSERSDAGVLV